MDMDNYRLLLYMLHKDQLNTQLRVLQSVFSFFSIVKAPRKACTMQYVESY